MGDVPLGPLRTALRMPLRQEPLWDGLVLISQCPALKVDLGSAALPAQGQSESGDGWACETMARGIQLLALSDGMGHGAEANRESAAVLTMLRQGFVAGYGCRELLSLINDLMRSCHGAERYATMDLCLLDLKNGEAAFEKLGACASYLLRHGQCCRLAGGTLPMGILEDVSPRSFRMRLQTGDLLVMLSDGVLDAFPEEPALFQAMSELAQQPQAFAEGLLRAALRVTGGKVPDDMTVLTAAIQPELYRA
jgi:stage II sporulation protein E